MDKEAILTRMQTIYDPEHPVSILELGIVTADDITIDGNKINVIFTPTSPFCPMGAVIGVVIKKALQDMYPQAQITVTVKPGSHVREEMVNKMINDNSQYDQTIKRLEEAGALSQCLGTD